MNKKQFNNDKYQALKEFMLKVLPDYFDETWSYELLYQKCLEGMKDGVKPNSVIITPTSNDTSLDIGGTNYIVPTLSVDELTEAYNSVVSGNTTYITNKSGQSYFTILQADSIQDVDVLTNLMEF